MPLSDYDLALQVQTQYDGVAGYFDHDVIIEGDRVSLKYFSDCTTVVEEGSHDFLNWLFNLQAVIIHPIGVGCCGVEEGFYNNIPESSAQIIPLIPKDKIVYCVGHSRGAGRAYLRALWLAGCGYKVIVVVFGSPRPGETSLKAALHKYGVEIHSYCNGNDPVCKIPVYIPEIAPYVEPASFIMLNEPPAPDDAWGQEIGWHHLSPNYVSGVKKYLNL